MHRFAFLAAALATISIAACGDADSVGSDSSEAISAGSWKLSPDAEAAGKVVRLAYDAAPIWTGTSTCSGKLKAGARDVGAFLSDRYAAIDTVGGYSCRRNTADSKRMSVHGTGRALDLMISPVKGEADSTHGDPIANYLVQNAERIGIQLIIWNHTVWRANGTNTARYTGPIPHTDHIHVELTLDAAARQTAWFEAKGTLGDASMDDDDASTGTGDPTEDTDAGDPDPTLDDDASVPPEGEVDAGPINPTPDPKPTKDASTADAAPSTPSENNGAGLGPGQGYELEQPDDQPAPNDALGPRTKHPQSGGDDASSSGSHGCSAAPVDRGGSALALAAVVAFVLAKRRRR